VDQLKLSKICHERMQGWVEELVQASCTPVLLVGAGQGAQRGQIHIFAPGEVTDHALVMIIQMAALELKRRGLWERASQVFSELQPIKEA